jgi:hypothetical protein
LSHSPAGSSGTRRASIGSMNEKLFEAACFTASKV